MAGLLEGRAAFVTGGAAGLGLAIAEAFAEAGARGMVFDIVAPRGPLPKGWHHQPGDVREEKAERYDGDDPG